MPNQYPKYVTPSIASEIFSVTTQTLRRWAKEGRISFIKTPGGQYRYNVEGVIGLIEAAPAVKKPRKHPLKPAPVAVTPQPLPAMVMPQAAPSKVMGGAALDPAALMQKIEQLATASATT